MAKYCIGMLVGNKSWNYLTFIVIILSIYAIPSSSYAREGVQLLWKFQTGGKVYSSPTIDKDVVYIGSWDTYLYAINKTTGTEKWKFKTNYPIQSKPAVYQNIVCFESGDEFWGVDKTTGEKVWQFSPQISSRIFQIDTWDYHHSSPVLVDSTFFVGCGNSEVYGFNARDGAIVFEYQTNNNSAVRTDVTFNDSTLYFGDWKGTFYALDIRSKTILWSEKTSSTSAVTSSGVIYNDMVLFGGRCTKVFGKDAKTGVTRWKYTDPIGSWMVADPVIDNGVLFFGGSDNNFMFAFQAETGAILWKSKKLNYNILSTPCVGSDYVIFATENAYGDVPGILWIVNKYNGKVYNNYQLAGNIVSSPFVEGDTVYFGCEDGYVYAMQGFTSSTTRLHPEILCDTNTIAVPDIPSTATTCDTSFYVFNRGSGYDSVTVSISVGQIQRAFSISPSTFLVQPGDSQKVTFSISPNLLSTGIDYYPQISLKSQYNLLQTVLKRTVRVKIYQSTGVKERKVEIRQFQLYQNCPNPFNPTTVIRFSLLAKSRVRLSIYDILGREIEHVLDSQFDEGYQEVEWKANVSTGVYLYRIEAISDDDPNNRFVAVKKMILLK